jgi:asparagine synthase (glutamine-hydrolysing)
MCGICGILNLAGEPVAHRERIDAMALRLNHRGPDSRGKFEKPHVALAIRRLSIIDLETGDQPLSSETGDVALVFNGEIYNYRELRPRLLGGGHQFKTRSDGEVIVHLYEDLGADFVCELNGMFAIALWDERARRLVLARDRAGEKPLYYWSHGETLVFGSEIKALLEYPGISRTPDFEALTQYFLYGYVPAPRTAYAEIRKLPAGHRLTAERGEIRVEAFWRMQNYLRPAGLPGVTPREERCLVEGLRERLREAAISRLVSDVPLGVFLSGGVDSSMLVAIMSELTPGNVSTFSVKFPERAFSEEQHANLVAQRFKTRHHVLTADQSSLREALDTLQDYLDEPLADPAVLPTFLMSRFSRPSIKVALSGEGSDELFGGYVTYLGANFAPYYLRLPRILRRQLFERLQSWLPRSSVAVPMSLLLGRFVTHAEREPAERHQVWFGMFSPAQLDQLFCGQWNASGDRRPPGQIVFSPLARVLEGARFDEITAEMLYLDFRLYLEDNLLVKVDRASMACSLEVRTPYLDHRLVEFTAALPASLKVRGWRLKYLFKKAAEKWLPREIVYRQKQGFSLPIAGWMRTGLRPLLEETLGEEKLKRDGFFSVTFVRGLLEEHWARRADHRKALWTLLCFQLWYDRWVR